MSTGTAGQNFPCSQLLLNTRFDAPLKSSDLWKDSHPNNILATVSNGTFWNGNAEEDLQKKIAGIKRKFHQERQLLVKHLPRNVTKSEIAELLKDFPTKSIQLLNRDDTSGAATVLLKDPEILDDWDKNRTFLLRGQSIFVSPTSTETVLCVARLPLTYTEDDFYKLIRLYGDIKMYFLMISEKTGKSKGYGFVQYGKKESALTARNNLNDKLVDAYRIVCDWVDSSHLTLKSLHSKCLYVDNLPKNFKDMSEFRKIFSTVVNPPYCQIALKNGCLQDWGLVEYLTAEDAELVQTSLNGYRLKDQPIRVSYYIPGVRAINLYLQLLNDAPAQGKSTGLLPEPTGQSVMMSIQNLSKHNPVFAHNLRNIILSEIHESKTLNDTVEDNAVINGKIKLLYNGNEKMNYSNGVAVSNVNGKSTITNGNGNGTNHNADSKKKNNVTNDCSATSVTAATNTLNTAFLQTTKSQQQHMSSTEKLNGYDSASLNNPPPPPPPAPPTLPMNIPPSKNSGNPYWNDIFGYSLTNNATPLFNPFVSPPVYPESAAVSPPILISPTTQLAPGFIQDVNGLPLSMQQSILNIVNGGPAALHRGQLSFANLGMAGTQSGTFPYSTMASPIDTAAWPFVGAVAGNSAEGAAEMRVSLSSQLISPLSMVNPTPKTATGPVFSGTWSPIQTLVPSPIPAAMFASAADWHSQTSVVTTTGAVCTESQLPSTPVTQGRQKRKILPSPEPSPEGNYIGQHSQGIGGHYADSYFKKKKMQ